MSYQRSTSRLSRLLFTHTNTVLHNYTRFLEHIRSIPGVFSKLDLGPLSITSHQCTPSFIRLFIRLYNPHHYARRRGFSRALTKPRSSSAKNGVAAELRAHTKSGRMAQQGHGWVMEGGAGSPYAGTLVSNWYSPVTPAKLTGYTTLGVCPSVIQKLPTLGSE